MKGISGKFRQLTFEDFPPVTSSQELVVGVEPCDSLDGMTLEACGPEVVPVNRSRQRVKGKGKKTKGTSGPTFSGSSASAALSASLANRLKERLGKVGSMVYKQTWKEKSTPSGIVYSAHIASVPTTKDSGSTGSQVDCWQTMTVEDAGRDGSLEQWMKFSTEQQWSCCRLRNQVHTTPWPTPSCQGNDQVAGEYGESNGTTLGGAARLAPWPTPMAGSPATETYNEAGNTDSSRKTVSLVDRLASWATPTTRDHKDGACQEADVPVNCLLGRQVTLTSGPTASSFSAETESGGVSRKGVLNPAFSLWLMGFPAEWLWHAPEKRPSPRFKKKGKKKSGG